MDTGLSLPSRNCGFIDAGLTISGGGADSGHDCGIYGFLNVETGKWYVGQTKMLNRRRQLHIASLKKGTHHNQYLQRSFARYGEGAFIFIVLECVPFDQLDSCERKWITHYDSINPIHGYNNESGGRVYKNHSIATRLKMSNTRKGKKYQGHPHSEESKKKNAMSHMGKRHSIETRRKMSATQSQRKQILGIIPSLETRQKMAMAHKGFKHSQESRLRISMAQKLAHARRRTAAQLDFNACMAAVE